MDGPEIKDAVQISMDLAKLGGLKDIAPTEDLYSAAFKPVPTKP
jgi:NitT/TauT family transport system substrate-binding protein